MSPESTVVLATNPGAKHWPPEKGLPAGAGGASGAKAAAGGADSARAVTVRATKKAVMLVRMVVG